MTYGLCGCTACVFVSNNTVLHFMHDPSAEKVLQYIQGNYDDNCNNIILLKVPADHYKWKEPANKIWEENLKHLPVEFSPYSMSRSNDDKFNSSLYVKRRDDGIYYTGLWGEYKPLLKTTSIESEEKANIGVKKAVDYISPTIPCLLPKK